MSQDTTMPHRNPQATCGTCVFWKPLFAPDVSTNGECRARLPQRATRKESSWPETHRVDFCGQHPALLLPPVSGATGATVGVD